MVVLQFGLNPNLDYVPLARMLCARTSIHMRADDPAVFSPLPSSSSPGVIGSWTIPDRSEEIGKSDQRQRPRRLRSMMMVLDGVRCLGTDALSIFSAAPLPNAALKPTLLISLFQ